MSTIAIAVLICEVAIGIFIYYWSKNKFAQSVGFLNAESITLNEEIAAKSSMRESLAGESQQKARQLTSGALLAIQQHNILLQVKEEIEHLSTQAPGLNSSLLADKDVVSVIRKLDVESTAHWNAFIECFGLLYPKFLENIRLQFPNITDKELKLAALLRLSLDSKTIANLLNLSADSIKVFRHRLRKKLQLPEDANLYNYLAHFD